MQDTTSVRAWSFIFIAIFELILRRQNKILFGLLPWICGAILVLFLKMCVIDFKVMKKDVPELGIKKNSRLFYQPVMFRSNLEDLVFYKSDVDSKNYIAVLKDIKSNVYSIYILSTKETIDVPKSQIKGKVFLMLSP